MSKDISDLFSQIESDSWRKENDFSEEVKQANNDLIEAGNNKEKIIEILNKWLQKYQPCLFGRLAAKLDLLSFCILTEQDLMKDDQEILDKIQDARTKWTTAGYKGEKSGFILFISSPKIAYATPNKTLMLLTKKLCSYYLLTTIDQDVVYTDEIWLEKPGTGQVTWKWLAGVNYFCANADGRWWQDHRIPGGLAFSVNSVGHMAKSSGIAKIMNGLNQMLGIDEENFKESKVDSLDQALEFAMRTIAMASETISGKATELLPITETSVEPPCPIALPKQLVGKDHRSYKGYYHTDITIPSEYFTTDIARSKNCEVYSLDFTYLYDKDLSNPDFITMGEGRKVRSYSKNEISSFNANPKRSFAQPIEEEVKPDSRLYKIIKG
jgi:hypothetical protein